jgi:hypothetical protein
MERRAFPRFPSDIETTCRLVTDHITMPARIRNVSRVGINLLVDKPIEAGEMLQIDLPVQGGRPETIVLACIMHCSAQSGGKYSAGCMFSEELGEAELLEFGGQRERSAPNDQRAWKRFPSRGKVRMQKLPSEGPGYLTGDMVNISAAGAGIELQDRVEPGVVLSLELDRGSKEPFTILGCVVYLAERTGKGWLIGCNFIRELEETELKELT